MAKQYVIELDRSGVRELLHEIGRTACKEKAEEIARRCGDGYAADTSRLTTRTVASAYTATPEAMADNGAHNTLEKAMR